MQGGGQGAYDEDQKLARHLQEVLGLDFVVDYPKMPDEDRPEYEAWKDRIVKAVAERDGETILVGHSLGASFLLKYVSEEEPAATIAGLFLIAPPYWGAEDWEVAEYSLRGDFASRLSGIQRLFFYHSRDDIWVPYSHFERYAEKLPHAIFRSFDGRGHQFNDDLSEVASDIKSH
ncbi:RBBP9/YdeN family alpha/beta hydrolase [Paenibacillus sedimenti]|uniref:RBBP9/YdeN family alpha/beta hydrolase n=1 Tax=Paenibacillus sedimenti TaxID=2770274 RepID=UPI00289FF2ED|nr:alpha/beta fold hydrolase [Paenibacillus sedimenti]